MTPDLIRPDDRSDGWRVVLIDGAGSVSIVAGNGPTPEAALRNAIRASWMMCSNLAAMLHAILSMEQRPALYDLHGVAALFLAGEASREVLEEAVRAVEEESEASPQDDPAIEDLFATGAEGEAP